jgi:hypothetical protein
VTATTIRPATPAQVNFINSLRSQRNLDLLSDDELKVLCTRDASREIDRLKRISLNAPAADAALTPGVYRLDGQVYIVKPNREKTRLYAKRLVELGAAQGDRLNVAGDHVRIEFEYAPGIVRSLTPAHRMSADEGKALTLRYGRCICCGRALKVAESVERGIGPVCIKYFA